ncbi:SIS domain-containing protein [bacterium]|nr:SIS domain-containing protein [bacterium]
MHGEHTIREIFGQPDLWPRVGEHLVSTLSASALGGVREVVFTGCGSSYHLAEAGAKLLAGWAGVRTRFAPASELILFPDTLLSDDAQVALVALSRTGTTSEVLQAIGTFRGRAGASAPVVGITCAPESPLVEACDFPIVIPSREESVVMTQAFTGTLLALAGWALSLRPDPLRAAALREAVRQAEAPLRQSEALKALAAWPVRNFVFLGGGLLHAIASEGALKLQEMALEPSAIAFHALEYRHGPKSTAGPDTLVTLLCSEGGSAYEAALLDELKGLGARTLAIASADQAAIASRADAHFLVEASSDATRALLYTPFLQLLAYHRAVRNGTDPDAPRHLSRSVIL